MEIDTSERSPSIAEGVRRQLSAYGTNLRVSLPAVVTKWDAGKQMVSVKPLVKEAYLDEEDDRQTESMPVIPGVPVQFQGAGGYRLTFPISDGSSGKATTGLLIFSDRSLDRWLSGSGQEVDPEIDHEHALVDAVFIPGLNPFGAPLSSCPTDHATIGADSGPQVHMRSNGICIGDEANAQSIALAGNVAAQLNVINQALLSWTPVPQDGGAALKAALIAQGIGVGVATPPPSTGATGTAWPANMGSSQAKAAQ